MDNTVLRIIFTIITIIWMVVIFMFSHSPSKESGDLSNKFIEKTIVSVVKTIDKNVNEKKLIKALTFPVRKMAHFTEYLILGVLLFLTFKSYGINDIHIPIILCVMYACTDEIHQYFIPGRACRILDVVIDSLGSATGIFLLSLFK